MHTAHFHPFPSFCVFTVIKWASFDRDNVVRHLIGERVAHDKGGVAHGAAQIHQPALGQHDDVASALHSVAVNLQRPSHQEKNLHFLTLSTFPSSFVSASFSLFFWNHISCIQCKCHETCDFNKISTMYSIQCKTMMNSVCQMFGFNLRGTLSLLLVCVFWPPGGSITAFQIHSLSFFEPLWILSRW